MAYCNMCGAKIQDGTSLCPNCGKVTSASECDVPNELQIDYPVYNQRYAKRKRPIYKRWWFWVLVVIVGSSVISRSGLLSRLPKQQERDDTSITIPATTKPEPAKNTPPSNVQESQPTTEDAIRPEVKDFLDSYEAVMNEYVDFMQRYQKAGTAELATMMGDYYAILSRYTEFAEKIDAFEEEELTTAELAYYLEVTNRVNQKLLAVAEG